MSPMISTTIGDNVWLVGNVAICQSVTIGTGSIVTRSIPANVLAACNPSHAIREFDS